MLINATVQIKRNDNTGFYLIKTQNKEAHTLFDCKSKINYLLFCIQLQLTSHPHSCEILNTLATLSNSAFLHLKPGWSVLKINYILGGVVLYSYHLDVLGTTFSENRNLCIGYDNCRRIVPLSKDILDNQVPIYRFPIIQQRN